MPDIRDIIRSQFTYDQLTVVGICYTASSAAELQYIVAPIGDTFPFLFDQEIVIFNAYEVYSTLSYFIIDQEGNVQFRIDDEYNRIDEMKAKIEELLSEY